MTRWLTMGGVLLMSGCAGMSQIELADCRYKIQEMQAMKLGLTTMMNTEPYGTPAHTLAYLQYRALTMNTSLYYHDPNKATCWENQP